MSIMGNRKSCAASTCTQMENEPVIYLAEQQVRRRPKRPAPIRQTTPRKRATQKAVPTTVKNLGLEMERLILRENQNRVMPRCSTPTDDMCFHCCHDHKEECCLYLNDEPIDGPRYSKWKYDLECPGEAGLPPSNMPVLPEAVSGNTTPQCFYGFPLGVEPPPPTVFLRQYYYPWFQPPYQPVELVPPPNFAAPPIMEPIPQYFHQQPPVQQHQPIQLQPFNQAFHAQPIPIGTGGSYYMTPMLYSVTPSSYYYTPPFGPSFVSMFSHS